MKPIMIVDCHTHIWQSPEQLGQLDLGDAPPPVKPGKPNRIYPAGKSNWRQVPAADPDFHWMQSSVVDKSIVLGFKSKYLRAEIPNLYISQYVNRFPQKLIGFAGIDPTERSALDELRAARSDLQLRGVTLSPANQDFHPTDTRAMRLYAEAQKLGMPILLHPVAQCTQQSKLEYARPYLYDEVAREFPTLRIIFAQLGHPWVDETICMLGKHVNVYADISGLLSRHWQAYNALVAAYQSQVIDKLLFGSDFPYTTVADCIEALYSINQLAQGTNLPVVPRESLRGIIERDTLGLLGLS